MIGWNGHYAIVGDAVPEESRNLQPPKPAVTATATATSSKNSSKSSSSGSSSSGSSKSKSKLKRLKKKSVVSDSDDSDDDMDAEENEFSLEAAKKELGFGSKEDEESNEAAGASQTTPAAAGADDMSMPEMPEDDAAETSFAPAGVANYATAMAAYRTPPLGVPMQDAFQPGASYPKEGERRRFLCWNSVGMLVSRDEESHCQVHKERTPRTHTISANQYRWHCGVVHYVGCLEPGLGFDVYRQNDASDFCQKLLERLQEVYEGTETENLMKWHLGGKSAFQRKRNCGNHSASIDGFSILQLSPKQVGEGGSPRDL